MGSAGIGPPEADFSAQGSSPTRLADWARGKILRFRLRQGFSGRAAQDDMFRGGRRGPTPALQG
jgi:hypothetical protein